MKLTWLSIFICVWNAIVSTQNQVLNERDSHRLRILLDNKEELKEPILTQAMAVAETHVPNALIETSDGTDKSSAKPLHRVYDPVSGLFCELIGDCHTCPLSEKVCLVIHDILHMLHSCNLYRMKSTVEKQVIAKN